MFLKEVYNPELSMTPHKSFVMKQASLAAFSIAARMKTNRLQYLDVRDHLENLASLFDFMQIRNREASGVSRTNSCYAFVIIRKLLCAECVRILPVPRRATLAIHRVHRACRGSSRRYRRKARHGLEPPRGVLYVEIRRFGTRNSGDN